MEFAELVEIRRAYRSLERVDITEETVRDLAQVANMAPSCFNNQPARFVFVYDPDILLQMREVMTTTNRWTQMASLIIAVFSRKDFDCNIKEREYYLFDTGMATAFLLLRATEMGLVAHPIAGFDEDKVKSILGIPGDMRVITLVNVGKKSDTINDLLTEGQIEREKRRPERLPFEKYAAINHFSEELLKEDKK